MRHIVSLFCAFFALSSCFAIAATIHVPADQPTIQAAINAAVNGDTVLVSPGTYKENIDFAGKAITVKSSRGAAATIIDGQQLAPVVTFQSRETRKAVLSGFTIQNGNGYPSYTGAGLNISNASPAITNNVIINNTSCLYGAVEIYGNAGPLIQANLISNNPGSQYCQSYGGLYLVSGSGTQIIGNVIAANQGAGIFLTGTTGTTTIQANTIFGNMGVGISSSPSGGSVILTQNLITQNDSQGIYVFASPLTMVNNTISENSVTNQFAYSGTEVSVTFADNLLTMDNNLVVGIAPYPAFYCSYYNSAPVLNNNDIFALGTAAYGGACPDMTGTGGNITADPVFADILSQNFHLQSTSPAIDTGTNSAPGLPATDYDGDPRIANNTVDIGVDEYTATPLLSLSKGNLYFGLEDVGSTSAAQTVTLNNNGTSSVALKMLASSTEYPETNTCGTSLAAGASCQISVSFSPSTSGIRPGAVGVFTSATQNPITVALTGTGVAPVVYLSNQYPYFYGQIIGTTGTQSSTLMNQGQAPLAISGFALSGATDFSETNDCPIAPATLAPGASCTITTYWTPVIVGSESAIITITDNATPNTQTIYPFGTSYSAGIATFSSTSLTFPDTLVGNSSQPQTVTLTNTGSGALGNLTVNGSGDFPTTSDCPSSLSPGAKCTITVTFSPIYPGSLNETLYVSDDGLSASYINVTGNADSPVPSIMSISLNNAPVQTASVPVTITGTGFVYGSQVLVNGAPVSYYYGGSTTQIIFDLGSPSLAVAGTLQISVLNPSPGGGVSNSIPFTVYTPVNYSSQSTSYNYRNITGTNLNLTYYALGTITSPFPIQFGGGSYSTLSVSSSGIITFDVPVNSEYNGPVPGSSGSTIVSPFWANLYPFGLTDNNNIFWQVNGTAPSRELVVEWRNIPYCCGTDSQHTIKFEVVFFEGSPNVLFNYADTIFGGSYASNDNGATATSGIQIAPNEGTQFSYNIPSLMSKTALLWYPNSPTASVSTSALNFGYHQIGTATLTQQVTLTNGGLVPLTIGSISIDNSDFSQTNNCGSSVAAGKSCTLQITFKPTQPVAESATLSINDNAINNPQTVTLSGTGAITSTVIFPVSLNFAMVKVGQSSTLPVTLANASNQPLTIQQIATSPAVYSQTNACGTSLAAGASCTINVKFTPTQAGLVKGSLSMALNGKALSAKVKLSGSGM